ncbi:9286_t:CDS:2, partial [Paraglomus occultum]
MTDAQGLSLWIRLENDPSPEDVNVPPECTHLSRLAHHLKQQYDILKDVRQSQIKFILNGQLQRMATRLDRIDTTDEKPLVIRFPLSDNRISIRMYSGRNSRTTMIPHYTDMWECTRQFAMQAFEVLKSDSPVNFWFVDNKTSTEITNEF